MAILSKQSTRRQLTLFVKDNNGIIEKIRKEFNPAQHKLISAHVTLCRENEILPIDKVIENLRSIKFDSAVKITFDPVDRFEADKGVWLPASAENNQFHELREKILKGVIDTPSQHKPHVTLMHPRNSTCTDIIFDKIKQRKLPTQLVFDTISLIEQENSERWTIIEEFRIISV